MQWFAQVQGQVYGPYDDALMQNYVAEGRINGESLISNNPPEGFYRAAGFDIFSFWAGTGQVMAAPAVVDAASYNQYAAAQMTPNYAPVQTHAQPSYQISSQAATGFTPDPDAVQNIFMVMAEVRSEGMMDFLTQLQDFGAAERVGDSVWLLKSSATVDMLRNSLSQSLSRQDRMFIVDCTQNKTAWFNIGADLDNRIRTIWED